MTSEQTKKDFAGMQNIAEKQSLKLLSCIFTDETGRISVYSIDMVKQEHLIDILGFAMDAVKFNHDTMSIVK